MADNKIAHEWYIFISDNTLNASINTVSYLPNKLCLKINFYTFYEIEGIFIGIFSANSVHFKDGTVEASWIKGLV